MTSGEVSIPPHLLTLEFLKPAQTRALFERMNRPGVESNKLQFEVTAVPGGSGLKQRIETVVQRFSASCSQFQVEPIAGEKQLEQLSAAAQGTDVICASFRDHRFAERLAEKLLAPVVNLGSTRAVPCRVLADCYTVRRRAERYSLCFVGRPGAYCHSLMRAAALFEFELKLCLPPAASPDQFLLESLRARGTKLSLATELALPDETDFVCLGPDYEAVWDPGELAEVLLENNLEILGADEILRAPDRHSELAPVDNLFDRQQSNFELLIATLLSVYSQSENFS